MFGTFLEIKFLKYSMSYLESLLLFLLTKVVFCLSQMKSTQIRIMTMRLCQKVSSFENEAHKRVKNDAQKKVMKHVII